MLNQYFHSPLGISHIHQFQYWLQYHSSNMPLFYILWHSFCIHPPSQSGAMQNHLDLSHFLTTFFQHPISMPLDLYAMSSTSYKRAIIMIPTSSCFRNKMRHIMWSLSHSSWHIVMIYKCDLVLFSSKLSFKSVSSTLLLLPSGFYHPLWKNSFLSGLCQPEKFPSCLFTAFLPVVSFEKPNMTM